MEARPPTDLVPTDPRPAPAPPYGLRVHLHGFEVARAVSPGWETTLYTLWLSCAAATPSGLLGVFAGVMADDVDVAGFFAMGQVFGLLGMLIFVPMLSAATDPGPMHVDFSTHRIRIGRRTWSLCGLEVRRDGPLVYLDGAPVRFRTAGLAAWVESALVEHVVPASPPPEVLRALLDLRTPGDPPARPGQIFRNSPTAMPITLTSPLDRST